MNLLECRVTKVLWAPYIVYSLWCVDVEYSCYGRLGKCTISGLSKDQASLVMEGYAFFG